MKIIVDSEKYNFKSDERFLIPFMEYQHNEIRYGFADHEGNIVIPARYDKVFDDFRKPTDLVRVGMRFIIDYGTPAKPRPYTYFHCGIIDSTGKEVMPCDKYFDLYPSEEGRYIAYGGPMRGGCTLLTQDGAEIVAPDVYSNIDPFHYGFAKVAKYIPKESGREELHGMIDLQGKEVIPLGQFKLSSKWYEIKRVAVRDEKRSMSFSLDELEQISKGEAAFASVLCHKMDESDRMAAYEEQAKLVKAAAVTAMEEQVDCKLQEAANAFTAIEQLRASMDLLEKSIQMDMVHRQMTYGDSIVYVLKNGWYCMTYKGQMVVPFNKYAWIDAFDSGLARVRSAGRTGRVNNTSELIDLVSDEIIKGEENIRKYYEKERLEHPETFAKWGIINEEGKEVLPLEYDDVWKFAGKGRTSTKVVKDGQSWTISFANLKAGIATSANEPLGDEPYDDSYVGSYDRSDYFSIDDCYDYEGNFDYDRLEDAILDGEFVPEDW